MLSFGSLRNISYIVVMEKADYINRIIAERGIEYYNQNKTLLDAEYEYIETLGDISSGRNSKITDLKTKMETQEVYLKNLYEGCLVRYTTDGRYFVKFPGKPEYEIYERKYTPLEPGEFAMYEDRDMIFDPIMNGEEVTKEQYDNF
jgi:hypothetical protein